MAGDIVKVELDPEVFKMMQEAADKWNDKLLQVSSTQPLVITTEHVISYIQYRYVDVFTSNNFFCEYGKKSRKRHFHGYLISRIMSLWSCNVHVYTVYAEIFMGV